MSLAYAREHLAVVEPEMNKLADFDAVIARDGGLADREARRRVVFDEHAKHCENAASPQAREQLASVLYNKAWVLNDLGRPKGGAARPHGSDHAL